MTSQGLRASHVILEREWCFNERMCAKSRGNRTRFNSLEIAEITVDKTRAVEAGTRFGMAFEG